MKSPQVRKSRKIHSESVTVDTATSHDEPISKPGQDLFKSIKGLVYLGKAIGLIPCGDLGRKPWKCNWFGHHGSWRIGYIISVCISITTGINALVCFIGMCRVSKKNAADLAWAAATWVFYFYGTFLYIYFLREAQEFFQLFPKWTSLQLHASLHDKTLSRDAGIAAGLIFTSAVMENLLLQIIQFPAFEDGIHNTIDSVLETYYHRSHRYWSDLVPYHWFWAVFGFIANKLSLYAWNFVDILIAVLSRAIYAKFKLLYEDMEMKISHSNKSVPVLDDHFDESKNNDDQLIWVQLARDHSTLCNLLYDFERFLSPLIFCSYGINIYYACLQLLIGLTPGKDSDVKSTMYTIYATWSFIHLLTRLYIVSISAANVNVHAHLISRVLRQCPVNQYTQEVERVERKVNTGTEIGLGGLGCFTITKPFILSIIGVVFTFEIVLLQASPPPNTSSDTNCTNS